MPRSITRSTVASRAADMPTAAGRLAGRPSLGTADLPGVTGCSKVVAASNRFSDTIYLDQTEKAGPIPRNAEPVRAGNQKDRVGASSTGPGAINTESGKQVFHLRDATALC